MRVVEGVLHRTRLDRLTAAYSALERHETIRDHLRVQDVRGTVQEPPTRPLRRVRGHPLLHAGGHGCVVAGTQKPEGRWRGVVQTSDPTDTFMFVQYVTMYRGVVCGTRSPADSLSGGICLWSDRFILTRELLSTTRTTDTPGAGGVASAAAPEPSSAKATPQTRSIGFFDTSYSGFHFRDT